MNHLFLHFPQKACGDKVREKNTGNIKKKIRLRKKKNQNRFLKSREIQKINIKAVSFHVLKRN